MAIAAVVVALLFALGRALFARNEAAAPTHSAAAEIKSEALDFVVPNQDPDAAGGAPPEMIEICGLGRVATKKRSSPIPAEFHKEASDALKRLYTDLESRPDDYSRGTGTYLQILAQGASAQEEFSRSHSECGIDADNDCSRARWEAEASATAASRNALAHIAAGSRDPEVYSLALNACGSNPSGAPSDCALLSYAQWAQIDPGNALPWLLVAGDASRQKDAAAFQEALFHASKAETSDTRASAVLGFLSPELLDRQTPPAQLELVFEMMSANFMLSIPNWDAVLRYCKSSTPGDTVAETCTNLAVSLLAHGTQLIDVLIASDIAQRLGWTDARIAPFRDRADAIRWSIHQEASSPEMGSPFSCDALNALRRKAQVLSRRGETSYFLDEIARRNMSLSDAAMRWRMEHPAQTSQSKR